MKENPINVFRLKHPVMSNALIALVVLLAGGYACLMMLDIFTNHGQEVKVPDVRYKPYTEAISLIEDAGLHYEIDSIYNEDYRPGVVIDQSPNSGTMVKATRTVYLTVNMTTPPKVQLPKELSDMPGSDGVTMLKSLGFRNVNTDTIASDKLGLIIHVSVNGHRVALGSRAALNARITLSIGDGSMDTQEYDPLGDLQRDSLIQEQLKKGILNLEQDSNEVTPHIVQ